MVPGHDLRRPVEFAGGADDLDAQALEAFLAVVRGDAGDHVLDVAVDPAKVDLGLVAVDAEAAGAAHGFRGAGGGQQRTSTARSRS